MIDNTVMLDLKEIGVEGTVELAIPSFNKKRKMKNEMGRCAITSMRNGEPTIENTNLGDLEIIKVLAFVRTAPFPTDFEGFLRYCDELDAKDNGLADDLFNLLNEGINRLGEEPGPLEN